MNATEGAGSGGACSSASSSREDEALAAHALDVDGHERAELDQLLAQLVAPRPPRDRIRRGDAVERAAGAAGAEQAVGAVPGQELVPELFSHRHLVREQLGREQPFEEVVVPAGCPRAGPGRARPRRCTPRARRARRSPASRTSPSALRARARNRAPTARPPRGSARARARPPRRSRRGSWRGTWAPCGPSPAGTRGTRSPGRTTAPCWSSRRSPGVRRARRTRRARSRRRARAARGRGSGRRPRSGRTGSTRTSGRPRAPRPGLPRQTARARGSAARRESDAPPRP